MNLDFLSGLLKGQGGSSPLTALLPLLLGGNKPSLSSLLGAFGRSDAPSGAEAFPPLFGSSASSNTPPDAGLFNVLNRLFASRPEAKKEEKTSAEYPYELQYNRPDIHKMHKN